MSGRTAGWYYVPYAGMRYWDGKAWADGPARTTPRNQAEEVATESGPSPPGRMTRYRTLIGALLTTVVAVTASAVFAWSPGGFGGTVGGAAREPAATTDQFKTRVARALPTSKPTPAGWSSSQCHGSLAAYSRVVVDRARRTATLTGRVVNETGFDVDVSTLAPVVSAWDTNGQRVILNGDFRTPPAQYPTGIHTVFSPGESKSYRSALVLVSPDRFWDSSGWNPVAQFADSDVITFCRQGDVPGYHQLDDRVSP